MKQHNILIINKSRTMIHIRKLFFFTCLLIILSGVTCLRQILDPNFNCRSLRNLDISICSKENFHINIIPTDVDSITKEEDPLPAARVQFNEEEEMAELKRVNLERSRSIALRNIQTNPINIEEIQQLFADTPLISIRGLVSSGTNWLRQLIQKNCNKENILFQLNSKPPIDADGLYGWKHALILKKEIDMLQQTHMKHSIIAITRDALTWIHGAFKMKAYVFLSPKFYRTRVLSEYAAFEVTEPMPYGTFYLDRYYEKDYGLYMLRANSVFELRKLVYQNYLEASQTLGKQMVLLRYEDLLQATKGKFTESLKSMEQYENCFKHRNMSIPFDDVQTYVKYGMFMENQVSPKSEHPREKFCYQVQSEEEYSSLLNLLDLNFEKEIGYTYPNTRAEYCINTNSTTS